MGKLYECKPDEHRKRGDFGYCGAVQRFIYKLKDDIAFYDEKINEAMKSGDILVESTSTKAIIRAQEELEKWNREKTEYCDNLSKSEWLWGDK